MTINHPTGGLSYFLDINLAALRFSSGGKLYGLTLVFGNFSIILTTENVGIVANCLDRCAAMSGTGGHKIRQAIEDEEVAQLTIARHRRHSVMMVGKRLPTGETVMRVLTLDVACDLAEQLRRALA